MRKDSSSFAGVAPSGPPTYLESLLARTVHHVARARVIVDAQRLRVDKLKALGAATKQSTRMLETFLITLQCLEGHERHLRSRIMRDGC
jgi:hypothetical protein